MVAIHPIGSLPGIRARAINPAINPTTIIEMIPIPIVPGLLLERARS
jgi:hypothetical protein